MSDIEREVRDGEEEVEGSDPRNAYERYLGGFDDLVQFGQLEQKISKGGYFHKLPKVAENEAAFMTGKKKWVDGKLEVYDYDEDLTKSLKKENPTNLSALYPWVEGGVKRRKEDLEKAKKDQLEDIIHSTPDNVLEAMLGVIPPQQGLTGGYDEIAQLHAYMNEVGRLFEETKKGKNAKGDPLNDTQVKKNIDKMRDFVEEYYKTHPDYLESTGEESVQEIDERTGAIIAKKGRVLKIKPHKQAVLDLILETIKYSDGFVLRKMERILGEKSQAFEKALEGKKPDYVKATLMKLKDMKEDKKKGIPDGEDYVFNLYESLFSQKYKGQEE